MKYLQTLILVLISIFMSNETFGASSLTDKVPANGELFYIITGCCIISEVWSEDIALLG